jgi:hypothetical protein
VRYDSEDDADHDTDQRHEIAYSKRHLPLPRWATARSEFLNERAAGKFHGESDRERENQRLHARGPQTSMNCVRFMLPSPAFAPLRAGLLEVVMQPEHASATAITRTSDLIRLPPTRKYRP